MVSRRRCIVHVKLEKTIKLIDRLQYVLSIMSSVVTTSGHRVCNLSTVMLISYVRNQVVRLNQCYFSYEFSVIVKL